MNIRSPLRQADRSAAARAELEAVLAANPEIAVRRCGDCRHLRHAARQAHCRSPTRAKLFESGMQIPLSLHLMDVRGEMMNPSGRGYSDGDPDGTAWPIPGTVMEVWGADPPRAQMLMRLRDGNGRRSSYDPRAVLERVLARFDELGLTPVCAHELEFYLIDEQARRQRPAAAARSPAHGRAREHALRVRTRRSRRYQEFLTALNDAAALQRVPISATSKEYAPGQFEANLRHQANALTASDHAIFLRQIVKAAAASQGFQATFMAKPYPDRSGSGQHVHVSLVDRIRPQRLRQWHARGQRAACATPPAGSRR